MASMEATYRIQVNRDFTFADARGIVPYLRRLGVDTLYLSPILKAQPGSTHGYDGVDPTVINPELGGDPEFDRLHEALQKDRMGLLVDIVPNHIATHPTNPTWMDILEHGPASRFASWYDIDWSPARQGRGSIDNAVLLPVLGSPYGEVLEKGELRVEFEAGSFFLYYYEHKFPIDPATYHRILRAGLGSVALSGPVREKLLDLITLSEEIPYRVRGTTADGSSERYESSRKLKDSLAALVLDAREAKGFLGEALRVLNGRPGEPLSFVELDHLLTDQAYRLVFWKTGRKEINYRRFFNINHLIALRMEQESVFHETHDRILKLVREGRITGLRIDHVDGLADPKAYLERLREEVSVASGRADFPIFVEKILAHGEELRGDWPIQGTTGYDFLIELNSAYVDPGGFGKILANYRKQTGLDLEFEELVHSRKKYVMRELFTSRVRNLQRVLYRLATQDRYACDILFEDISAVMEEVSASLRIYRTYVTGEGPHISDREWLDRAFKDAESALEGRDPRAVEFFRRVVTLDFPVYLGQEERQGWKSFVRRWQQFTGPMMAKGHEDTALYIFNALTSLNEVGGDPGVTLTGVESFHRYCEDRALSWPHSLGTTSTHDTKRSEDVRARINTLSEVPDLWNRHLSRWLRMNDRGKAKGPDGRKWPEKNMEILLYQALLGIWPLEQGRKAGGAARAGLGEDSAGVAARLKEYAVKAAREAKVHTDWIFTNEEYEKALERFVDTVLKVGKKNAFLADFLELQRQVAFAGAMNSLSQVLVKSTAPGVPDFYQGCELWDFSLVDPDNRRPVDYELRAGYLSEIEQGVARDRMKLCRELVKNWKDGRIKLFTVWCALQFRRQHGVLFDRGEYLPLRYRRGSGSKAGDLIAFARRSGGDWSVTLAPRLVARGTLGADGYPARSLWKGGTLSLPKDAPSEWVDVFTGREFTLPRTRKLDVAEVLELFPGALLRGRE